MSPHRCPRRVNSKLALVVVMPDFSGLAGGEASGENGGADAGVAGATGGMSASRPGRAGSGAGVTYPLGSRRATRSSLLS